ncbi:MAG: App1 family protein [Saprospiraceae bacterium]
MYKHGWNYKWKGTLQEKFFNWLKKLLKLESPPVITAYRGYGTSQRVITRGHVLDDRVLYEAQLQDTRRKNLWAMISRYLSRGLPQVRVGIRFSGHYQEVVTNEKGYFEAIFHFESPLLLNGWVPIEYQVLDKLVETQEPLVQTGEIYILEEQRTFGIISDVDDTILISHATNIFRKFWLVVFKNSKTRLPFTGVASFYWALHQGRNKAYRNPIFYVSSSEWNLYDFLEDFCRVRNIPKGPFLLKSLKTGLLELFKSGGGSHLHKKDKIEHLLDVFPDVKFILIGDSGQHDAVIYTEIAEKYPNRILALYIRKVSERRNLKIILHFTKQLKTKHLDLLLVNDTAEAARHAHEKGFIDAEEYERVKAEVAKAGKNMIFTK